MKEFSGSPWPKLDTVGFIIQLIGFVLLMAYIIVVALGWALLEEIPFTNFIVIFGILALVAIGSIVEKIGERRASRRKGRS